MLSSLFLAAVSLTLSGPARASCGSYSCPIDVAGLEVPKPGAGSSRHLSLDASYQYIDQNAPRAGLHRAAIGEVPNPEHNEVRTINRLLNLRADYNLDTRWGFAVLLPLITRTHDHIEVASGDNEHWSISGAGDVVAQARYAVLPRTETGAPRVLISGGVKLPTGRTGARNDEGEVADPTLQPGSGSWDLLFGATYEQDILTVPMLTGDWARLPFFASAQYKQNNPGTNGYRFGDEAQANLGAAYALLRPLDFLLQSNFRVRMRDYNGDTGEDTAFTGGNFLYMSPGLRVKLSPSLSAYGYLQLPLYQRVNQEQLTADRHWLFGLSYAPF